MLPEKAICISQAKKSVFRMFLYHDSKISLKMKNSDNQPAVSYTKYQTSGSPDFFLTDLIETARLIVLCKYSLREGKSRRKKERTNSSAPNVYSLFSQTPGQNTKGASMALK